MAVKMKNLVTDKFYFQLSISLIEERWFLKVFLVSGKDETFIETFLNFVCSHNRNQTCCSCVLSFYGMIHFVNLAKVKWSILRQEPSPEISCNSADIGPSLLNTF